MVIWNQLGIKYNARESGAGLKCSGLTTLNIYLYILVSFLPLISSNKEAPLISE
jgi:hypothetical protein